MYGNLHCFVCTGMHTWEAWTDIVDRSRITMNEVTAWLPRGLNANPNSSTVHLT